MKNPTLKLCVILFTILLIIAVSIILVGCSSNPNEQASRGYTYYAMVRMPDGSSVGGRVSNYYVRSNGRASLIIDGVEYSTHISNVVLTRETSEIYSSHSEESE